MSHTAMILFGYAVVIVGVAGYAGRIVARGRRLARQLPDEAKPWI